MNFLHFPPNKKPVIRLKTNTPASIDEDSEYGVAPLSSFVEITDPMPEGNTHNFNCKLYQSFYFMNMLSLCEILR